LKASCTRFKERAEKKKVLASMAIVTVSGKQQNRKRRKFRLNRKIKEGEECLTGENACFSAVELCVTNAALL